jgi:hypothetical protein
LRVAVEAKLRAYGESQAASAARVLAAVQQFLQTHLTE